MTENERLKLAQWTVENSQNSGAKDVSVSLFTREEFEAGYRNNKLENLTQSTRNLLYLQIYVNNRFSSHFTSNIKKESLKKFIEEAVAMTKYLAEDKYRSLPNPKYYPQNLDVDLKICDSSFEQVTAEEKKQFASEIQAMASAASNNIVSVTAWYADAKEQGVRVHSNGLTSPWKATEYSPGAYVTVADEAGTKPAGHFGVDTRYLTDVPKPEKLAEEAVKRALTRIGQKKIESGKYDMLIENRSVSKVIGMLIYPMTANALQQKRSFLESMLDKKIASEKLTLIDDPLLIKGIASRHFDSEGLAGIKRTMIDKGILKNYYIDNYYGRKLGLEPTSGSTSNLIFEKGSKPLDELIKGIEKGILVTGFIGGNSNSTTGDFSFGIVGQLIEQGNIVRPVNEMNITGNAKELWTQLIEVGNDPDIYSAWQSPSMLFKDVSFSGI